MKWNITDFPRKCQHSLLIAAGTYPAGVLLTAHTAPEMLTHFWPLTVAFVLLAWLCLVIPGKRRLLAGITGAALLTAAGYFLLDIPRHPFLVLLAGMYAFLLLYTLPIGGWTRTRELVPAWHIGGFALHAVMQFLINITHRTGINTYLPAEPLLLCMFLLFTALAMLSMNRSSLDTATQSRRTVPGHMRRLNTLFTMILLAVSVLISLVPAIGQVLNRLWDLLMRGIAFLVALITALMPQQSGQGGGGAPAGDMGMGGGTVVEESLLSKILEKLMLVVVIVVLAILIWWLGRKIFHLLKKLFAWLIQHLTSFGAASSEDYEDEISDTREDAEVSRGSLLQRLRMRLPSKDERSMSPNERVRYRYLRLRWRHPEWNRADTARETLPAEAAKVYEQARYSEEPVSDADAERFRNETRRLGN